ncbi:MAG: flippase-like domain-containing protein [Actinomycetota bacterium]|nr:flippase-like domain-containing protein [Actinomycetota bacterium]
MTRSWWIWARILGGCATLTVVLWRIGTGPFLDGVRTVDVRALTTAAAVAVPTTVCCAWRWSLVSRGLGVDMPLRTAVLSCYRSQFLNTTLPGGVLGDVHRGLRHGRDAGDAGRGLRTVAWERFAGQVVQVGMATVVLLALSSPVHASMPYVVAASVVALAPVALLARRLPRVGWTLGVRTARTAVRDLRDGLLGRRAWPAIVVVSALAVVGHIVTFLVAARTAGVTASPVRMLPLALLVLLAMGIPTNVAGWGPREGVAAWAFGAAGLGASQGVATSVVYGVMVLVAGLPGAGVLAVGWLRRDHARARLQRVQHA